MAQPLAIAVLGTDTGVGKTWVVHQLVAGLRAAGRRCWVHKPVACGGWDGITAEDGRALATLAGDGQDPASICPHQFPEPAAPHLAAAAAGQELHRAGLLAAVRALRGDHDLVVEGVGGLLVPLTPERWTLCDLVAAAGLAAVIVTRPHLGTLNHSALTVAHARARGIAVLGLVLNHHPPAVDDLAARSAARELPALCGVPLIAQVRLGDTTLTCARALAAGVLACWHAAPSMPGAEPGGA